MAAKWRPSLRQVFGFSLLGLLAGLAALFYLVLNGSERTLLDSSERYRRLASLEVAQRVGTYLAQAPLAVGHFEEEIHYGLIDPKKMEPVGQGLLSLLLANENISEATLTFADSAAYGAAKNLPTARPALSGQVAVLRSAKAGEFVLKRTWFDGTGFVSTTSAITRDASISPPSAPEPALDPTSHLTFQTAAKDFYGQLISTDLHWSQVDEALPVAQRRVELSVQKTIEDARGKFVGVVRIGLMKTQIDAAVRQHLTGPKESDPHLIFICDNDGRLITGPGGHDTITDSGDDLRVAVADIPPVVERALKEPALKTIDRHPDGVATSFLFNGQLYLCTYTSLPHTQDWIVGVVVPRDYYLGQLIAIRNELLVASLALMAALVIGVVLILRSVVRAQALILKETARMNRFEFAPSDNASYLSDVEEVLGGLERAKTAMRAMSKYVPVNLVRQLYREGQEPVLGAQISDLSVLFTDIRDFTAIAERTPPHQLAECLGRYLEVVAGILQQEKSTIDKFIGDAVMAFWNAPESVPHHALLACRAALRSRDALLALYESPKWGGFCRFETRFGLHRCQASVGHFGAPDRFNYTAIGDGINFAARLEGLNKYYGTTILASEMIYKSTSEKFEFRLLDRVAVKGKTQGITIYELLAEKSPGIPRAPHVERYEQAFAHYQRAEFSAALALMEQQPDDAPSNVLAQRCRDYIARPPRDWDGVHAFGTK